MKKTNLSDRAQLKFGAILSYLLIVLNTVFGLFVSPYILHTLGDANYGVYKTIASFSATLLVLDIGIGTTVLRYTAKYRAEKKNDAVGNFAAMALAEAAVVGALIAIVSTGLFFSIDGVYGSKFNSSELGLAKILFAITVVNIVCTIFDNVLSGVIMGMNRFVFVNGFKLLSLVTRMILIFVVLKFYQSAIALVTLSFLVTLTNITVNSIFIAKKLRIKIRFVKWDWAVFKESLGYSFLMFFQTIAIQANGNVDNVVIGAMAGAAAVAVYSFGLQLFNMYESLAMAFSNLMLPTVSQKIAAGADDGELQTVVTKVGRLQFLVLGAALVGFFCVGKEFVGLWLGQDYLDVYYLSLIMMVPVTFTLIENVNLSILRARNMMKFRTFSLVVVAILNVAISVVGMIYFNYYAAAVGTAASITLGSVVMMNVYYHKRIGFKVFKFYYDVLNRLLICAVVPGAVVYFLNRHIGGSWLTLLAKIVVYCVIYAGLLAIYGLNRGEKELILGGLLKKKGSASAP